MKIRARSENHIVELDDGSRWQSFPGDLDFSSLSAAMGSTLACMQLRDAMLGSGGRREKAESQRHGTIAIIGGFRDGRILRRGRMT